MDSIVLMLHYFKRIWLKQRFKLLSYRLSNDKKRVTLVDKIINSSFGIYNGLIKRLGWVCNAEYSLICMQLLIVGYFYSFTKLLKSESHHLSPRSQSNWCDNVCMSGLNVCQMMTGWVDLMFYEARMLRSQIRCHFVSSCLSISQVIPISCCIQEKYNRKHQGYYTRNYNLLLFQSLLIRDSKYMSQRPC